MQHLFMTPLWDTETKKINEKAKTSNSIVDHFPLTFVNPLLA